jgi:hypothetical protein
MPVAKKGTAVSPHQPKAPPMSWWPMKESGP